MSADSIRPTKLICPQGFYFETRPIFPSKEITINVLRALMGSREDMKDISVDDARNRAIEKLESLFSACLEKQVLFRAVRDSLVFWNTIAQDFEGCYALSPQDTRQVVVTYTEARHVYRGKLAPTNLNNLVDQWIQVMDQTNSLPPPDSLNLAWRPGTSDVPVQTAQNIGPASGSSINATWPPAHFSEDEVMLITSTAEFRQELYAITSLNQGSPRAIPTDLTQPKEVRMFLCWAALVGTPQRLHEGFISNPRRLQRSRHAPKLVSNHGKPSNVILRLGSFPRLRRRRVCQPPQDFSYLFTHPVYDGNRPC